MNQRYLFGFISLLLISISGCNNNGSNNFIPSDSSTQNKVFNQKISSTKYRDQLQMTLNGNGVGLGLYSENGTIDKSHIFYLKPNERLKKFISISNNIPESRVYKILLFIDFKQEEFSIDGRPYSDNYTFEMDSNETLEIPFICKEFSPGFHDCFFVIVKYPDKKFLDSDFRKQTDMNNLLFLRFKVSIENEIVPEYKIKKFTPSPEKSIIDGIFISDQENVLKRWLVQKIKRNDMVQYYAHVGNKKRDNKQYALIVLLDWKQVAINQEGDKTLYFELKENEMITIPSLIKAPEKKGIYDLSAILIQNPYSEQEIKSRGISTCIRVGIDVTN